MFRLSSVVFISMLSTALMTGCSEAESQIEHTIIRPVKLIHVSDLTNSTLRAFPAKVEANKQAELAFRISGELTQLPLVEGQKVKKGDVLARIDDRDAKNVLLLREADYELADADFRRKSQLLEKALISKADYDSAKAMLKSAKANLASAQDQLSYTKLSAPFDGTVAKRFIDNYQMVQGGSSILTLQRNDAVDIVIQVSESLIQTLKRDYNHSDFTPTVGFAVNPGKKYPLVFKEISTQVSPSTQTYEASFTLEQPQDIEVLPGMSAELTIDWSNASTQKAITLPVTAITRSDSDGSNKVWVYDEKSGEVHSTVVTLGKVRRDGIEVLSGINAGNKVVAAGAQHMSEGMLVKPLRWERGV